MSGIAVAMGWRGLAAAALMLLMAGCSSAPPAAPFPQVTPAMRAEVYERRAKLRELAALSARAYLTEAERKACPRILLARPRTECFTVAVPGPVSDYHAVYLIQTNDKTREQIIAIRGTTSLADALVDLQTGKTRDPWLGVPVHSGFQLLARGIHDDIKKNRRLKPSHRVFVTGHSLGGAAALLLGLYLHADPAGAHQIAGVYTYGQPKVLDRQGIAHWPAFARHVFRVVNCDDPIPILPINEAFLRGVVRFSFFDETNPNDYQHMGRSLLLMDDGHFSLPEKAIELGRDLIERIRGTLSGLWRGYPIDHAIARYITRIDALSREPPGMGRVIPPEGFPCARS